MKKTSSTEGLNRLAEARPGEHSGRPRIRRSASLGRPGAGFGKGRKVKSDQDLKQLSGASPGFSRASNKRSTTAASAAAMDYHTLPQNAMSSELAEDVMEASFARGLAAAECFELYGPVRQAPNLAGALPNAEHAASSQQLATSQQFAACLATPFTGTDKNMGEILRSEVDKIDAERELQTQLRYAEELRFRKEIAVEEDEEIGEKLEEPSIRRARLRRKPSDEVLDEQLMAEVAITGYKQPVNRLGDLPSPDAKASLDSIYGSMDDPSNKLVLSAPSSDEESAQTESVSRHNQHHSKLSIGRRVNIMAMSCAPDLF